MNKLIYILFFCFIGFYVNAQHTLSGSVFADDSGLKLRDVDVYLVEKDQLQNGQFEFGNLTTGDYTLIVFGIGYTSQEVLIKLVSDSIIDLILKPLANELTEVVIQDQKDEIFAIKRLRAVEGTAIYAGKKSEVVRLEKMMGNMASNTSRQIYAQIAGLNIYEGNDGGLQLAIGGRGLDPNRTANFNTRQNGYDISADVLGYPESYYTPPAEALSEIQIIRGAASLQYGTQFGGLINFKTHSIPDQKSFELISNHTLGSFGFFSTFNSVGFNKGRWTVNGYFNYKKGNGYRANSDFSAKNFFGSAKYRFSNQTSLKLEATFFNYLAQQAGGLTDQGFLKDPRSTNRTRNWFKVDWKLYNALFKHKFSSRSEMSLSVFALDASRFSLGFRGNPTNLNENPVTALDEQKSDGSFLLPRDLIKGEFNNYGAELKFLTRYKIKSKS